MKNYELESILKSFLLFFLSLTVLLIILFTTDYHRRVSYLKESIFAQMRLCSFDLQCPAFHVDFKKKDGTKPLFLYETSNGLISYFEFFGSKDTFIAIQYSKEKFHQRKNVILQSMAGEFLLYELLVAILSLLFSFYAISPMKQALITIEEFIKDILHDINTPITTIALNSSLLNQDIKNSEKIDKIQHAIKRIMDMQENMRTYLGDMSSQIESFDLRSLIMEQEHYCKGVYSDIEWHIDRQTMRLKTNKKLFGRIVTNLLSNASKYNKKNGKVSIHIYPEKSILEIIDSGVGIKNTDRIFERFYKEQERGTGVGLHIVKKLCDELGITISVESHIGVGTTFYLNLQKIREG